MKKLKLIHAVWLIPLCYLLHLAEEYYFGGGFPNWFSGLFNVNLSYTDFIWINSIAFTVVLIFAISSTVGNVKTTVMLALGTLFFINGLVHILSSLISWTYSPGTLTGLLLYVPLGLVIFKNVIPFLSQSRTILGLVIGVLIQIIVAGIAMTI